MKHITILIIGTLFFSACSQKTKIKTANPSSSKEVRELLAHLHDLSGKKTFTGQHNYLGRMSLASDSIKDITGKYPALWGSDFGFADSTHDIDNIKYRANLVDEIVKQHKNGSLITLTYHQANPVMGEPCQFKGCVQSKLSDEEWNDLITPGTSLYNAWCKQMDLLAEKLKDLQNKKIPVLFRPYHEMNGSWFWWGAKPGEKGFKVLWIQLFNYYTYHHKLNNLIWVWAPDKPIHGLREFYPGDEYVDIVGCDIYPSQDTSVVFRKEWYDELVALAGEKPLALTECSIIPGPEILEEQPRWLWFMVWDKLFKYNPTDKLKEVYSDPRYITLE